MRLLDTPMEDRFDRITRLALRLFEVPISTLSLVDSQREWFKSCRGLPVREGPRAISFCGHALHAEETLVVPDATRDPRFADNPMVIGPPYIRFYAGRYLCGPDGQRVGAFCIKDHQARELTDEEIRTLEDLAAWAELELNRHELGLALDSLADAGRQLKQAYRLQQAILDGVSHLVISTNVNGTITLLNAAAERSLGHHAGEVVGKATPVLFHEPAELLRAAQQLSAVLQQTVPPGFEVLVSGARRAAVAEREWTYVRKDGTGFPVRLAVTALRTCSTEITGFLFVATDLTEHKPQDAARALLPRQPAADPAEPPASDPR